MSLNVKNPKAYQLATQLAELTGESLTTAVILALEQRLRSEQARRGGKRTSERMMEFARRFAAGVRPGLHSSDHAKELYDDNGMPA